MLTGSELVALQHAQQQLDKMIFGRHQLRRDQTRPQRSLALVVELAELANVERQFKYWSRPRPVDSHRLTEEYVDALHFLLSLSLDLAVDFHGWTPVTTLPPDESTTSLFLRLLADCHQLFCHWQVPVFIRLLRLFLQLGVHWHLAAPRVLRAYWAKHKINQQRQLALY